jgi:protein-S-isoprenylcysteine O-methyltransferase Ste14
VPSWSKIARRIRVPLGFVFAGAYIWLARPTKISIAIGTLIAIGGLVIRALASGHVKKNEVLAVSGPYAYTRNPLYLGSVVLAVGFLIAAKSWWIALIALVMLFAIYFPVIRSEEAFLRAHFPDFDEYSRHVPRLFPRLRPYRCSSNSFSWHLYWKHREYNAAIGAFVMAAVLLAKSIWLER